MNTVNIHEAKTHLSRLVDKTASSGEPFIIAKSGRPMVKVIPCGKPKEAKRLGFLRGQGSVRADIKEVGAEETAAMFGGQ
ncbi:MAG: type II toxin-antitoxin system prevent-host-death family antitoxin [Planctomycetota bacterium]|nr:type II toxin-antitoxin system prevent-host-death family antitoxin [Planctomycetota bacterium]